MLKSWWDVERIDEKLKPIERTIRENGGIITPETGNMIENTVKTQNIRADKAMIIHTANESLKQEIKDTNANDSIESMNGGFSFNH